MDAIARARRKADVMRAVASACTDKNIAAALNLAANEAQMLAIREEKWKKRGR